MLACTAVGHAQFTWSPTANTGSLGTAGNWVGGIAPTSPANLSFSSWSAGKPVLTLTSAFTATSLEFSGALTPYELGSSNGSVLSLGAGGITVSNSSISFASTLGLTLLAQQSWTLNQALSVSGVISGSAGINKTGFGDLSLSGTNTFTGGLTMDGGGLYIDSSSTAVVNGSGVVTSVTNGPVGTGTLTFNQDDSLIISGDTTLHNAITLGGNVTLSLELGYDNLTLAGVISGTGSAHIHTDYGNGTLTLSGINTFPGGLDYQGYGTLILGTSSTGTIVNGVVTSVINGPVGTGPLNFYYGYNTLGVANANTTLHNAVQLGSEGSTTIDTGAGNLTLAGIISGGSFIKTGAGKLTLSGANTFNKTNTLSAGTLLLGSNGVVGNAEGWQITSGPIGTGLLYLDSGTTLAPVTGAGTVTIYNPVVLNDDATIGQVGSKDQLRFDTKPGLDSGLRASYPATNLTVAGGILTLASSPNYYSNYDYNLENITVNNGAAVIFAFADALPSTAVTVTTGGYVGVANGVLNTNPVGFLSTASDLVAKLSPSTFAGTFGFDSENIAAPGTYTGTLDFSAFSHANFAGLGTLSAATLGTGATLFAPNSGANAGKLAFSGLNGGTLQIETALLSAHNFTNVTIGRDDGRGANGMVALSSASNDYTGGTTLKSGTLIVRNSSALGTGPLTAANATNAPANSADAPKLTTTLAGGAPVTLTLPNALVVNTSYASSTFGLGVGGTDSFTLAGEISGTGIIDKYGTGTVSVTGNNSFTGKINVLGGTLSIGSGGTAGSLGVNIRNNATLAFNRSDALTYANVVSGTGSLLIQGAGTVTLTGANTYTGGTTVNAGTLSLQNTTGSATGTGLVTIAPAGTLAIGNGDNSGGLTGDIANAGALIVNRSDSSLYVGNISGAGTATLTGTGTVAIGGSVSQSGGITIGGGTLVIGDGGTNGTLNGNVTNNSALAFNRSDALTFSGNVSGPGSISQIGNGTLSLSGINTFSGGTTINRGNLFLGVSNALASTGKVAINATAAATTAKLEVGTGFSQTIGTLTFGGSDAIVNGNNGVTLYAGSTLTLGGTVTYLATNNPGAAFIDNVGGGTLALGGNRIFDIGNSTQTISELNINAPITGAGFSLTKTGAGRLYLATANTYSGGTIINSGELFTGANNALFPTGAVTINTTTSGQDATLIIGDAPDGGGNYNGTTNGYNQTIGSLTFGGAGANNNASNQLLINGPQTILTLGGDVTYVATDNPLLARIYGPGTLNLGGNRVFNIGDSSSAPTAELVITSAIAGTGFSLTKTGAGWLSLQGNNTYTGGTTISAGTLELYNSTLLGNVVNNASLVVYNSVDGTYSGNISGSGSVVKGANTGILTLTGNNTFTGGLTLNGPVSVSSDTNLGAASGSLTLNNNSLITNTNMTLASTRSVLLSAGSTFGGFSPIFGTTLTYGGVISGSGGLYKWNSGTLTLSGTNTYTGGTTIGFGTLQIGANGTTGSILGSIVDNATLTFARSDNINYANTISGSGRLVQAGSGTLIFSNNNTYTGGTLISSGTLQVGNGGASGIPGFGDVVNNSHLIFNRSDGGHYDYAISGTGDVTKAGAGTLIYTRDNTYSGGTIISDGAIQVGLNPYDPSDPDGLITNRGGTTGNIGAGPVLNNSHLIFNRSDNISYAGTVTGTGDLIKNGSGALSLTGANTYTGGTTIGSGTLQIGANGTTGSILGNVVDNATLAFARSDNVTFANIISGTGRLVQAGPGTLTLTGANTYAGTTIVSRGLLRVGTVNALPTTTELTIDSGATLEVLSNQTIAGFFTSGGPSSSLQISSGTTFTVAMPVPSTSTTFAGSVTGAGIFAVSGAGGDVVNLTGSVANTGGTSIGVGATLVIGTGGSISGPIVTTGTLTLGNSGSQTLNNVISGTGGLTATAGTTTLNGANLYTGPTNVNGGKLFVTNLSGSGTGTGTVTVGSGGTFGGTGTITGPLVLNGGGIVSPGASPGTLNVGATTFAGNAHFAFEINNATGTAGTNWDLLSVSGALTISANSGNPFFIDVKSLDSGNAVGLTPNFSSSGTYAWQFLSASGGIMGFAANAFTINGSQFQNSVGIGSFYVSQSGNNLSLNFIPIPEPSTYALLAVGLGLIVTLTRRRRS